MLKVFSDKKRSEQRKTFIILLLLASIMLGLFAIGGSVWIGNVLTDNIERDYTLNLQMAADTFVSDIKSYQKFAAMLSRVDWVESITYMQGQQVDADRVSIRQLENYRRILTSQKAVSNALDICLVFAGKDLVLGSGAKCDLRYLTENYLHIDGMTKDDWLEMGRQAVKNEGFFVYPDVHLTRWGTSENRVMLLAIPANPVYKSDNVTLFVVLRHQTIISAYFESLLSRYNGIELSITMQGETEPFLRTGVSRENERQLTITAQTEIPDMTVTITIPVKEALRPVYRTRQILLFIVLAMWLASLVMSGVLSSHLFKPIRSLLAALYDSDPKLSDINEYESISQGIEQLKERESAMKEELAVRRHFLRNAGVEKLLSGEAAPPEEICYLDGFEKHSIFCVCLLLSGNTGSVLPLPKQVEEAAQTGCIALRRSSCFVMIFGYDNTGELEDAMVNILARWENVNLAVGSTVNAITDIHESYRSAKAARDFRCVADGYRVLRLDNATQRIGYYMPQETENAIQCAICGGMQEKALEIFRGLYTANQTEHMTTKKGLANFLYCMNLSLEKILPEECGGTLPHMPDPDAETDALLALTEQNIARIADLYRQKQANKPARMERILSYVDANLTDPTLSLDMVAESFGISSSLVSRLFSEQHGESFHTYVNRLRIYRAVEYLMDGGSKMSISEIAEQVGYTNDTTFRRLFKKYTGVTPSNYVNEKLTD